MYASNVGQVCTQRAVTICANAPLTEAKQVMCDRGVDAVVVIASAATRPTALGIITQQDIARTDVMRAANVSRLRVSDVLSRNPLVFDQNEAIESVVGHLRARKTRYALVTGSGGAFCGLISLDSLLGYSPQVACWPII
jgi:signal-transduction protein with cAMP-binding, CBS, and nucleotidyltransferase domain